MMLALLLLSLLLPDEPHGFEWCCAACGSAGHPGFHAGTWIREELDPMELQEQERPGP